MNEAASTRRLERAGWATLIVVLGIALVALVREPRAAGLALTTLEFVGKTLILSIPAGTILAVLLGRTRLPGRGLMVGAWCLLLFLPLYMQASAWDAGFGQQGWFTISYGAMSKPWLTGLNAAVFIHAVAAIPWVMLIIGHALRNVDPELEELALMDASPWQVLWSVTLMRALPAVLAAALFIAVITAGDMTVTDIYRVRTYAEEVYTNAALTTDYVELGLSMWPHIAIIAVLVVIAWQASLRLAPIQDQASPRAEVVFDPGSLRWPLTLLAMSVTLFAVGLPVAYLVYKAGFVVDAQSQSPGWSGERFVASTLPKAANPLAWRFAAEYQATLLLATSVATLTTVVAFILALAAREGDRRCLAVILAVAAGVAIPGPLVALGIIWVLNRSQPAWFAWLYDETLFAPTIAISIRALPIATMLIWNAFRTVEQDQVDIARADGLGQLSLLWKVLIPQRMTAMAIAWLLAFAIGAGDLTSSLLVIPPGQTTIANQIFLLIHAGVHNAEAGLCLGQLAFFATIAFTVLALAKHSSRIAN